VLTLPITLAVLFAALLHAAWNALVKRGADPLVELALVTLGASVIALPLLPLVPVPPAAAWPFLLASVLIHVGYYATLVGTYRHADLSVGYPLMRGSAPLLVTLAGVLFFGEHPAPATWVGIVLICGGVLSLGLAGFDWRHSRVSTHWALANAFIIALYTLVDAAGVRAAEAPQSYVVWLFVLDALPFPILILALKRRELSAYARRFWLRGLFSGALSAAAYGVVLWAMTRAPVAAVAALRETSVIFAALIGAWLLKEGHIARRLVGAATVAAGVIALKI